MKKNQSIEDKDELNLITDKHSLICPHGRTAFSNSDLSVGFKSEFCTHAAASLWDLRFHTVKTLPTTLA